MRSCVLAFLLLVAGCANFDADAFNRALLIQYQADQAATDQLNASAAALARRTPALVTALADFDWDWDLQSNIRGEPIWVCRGVQTGQYAEITRCGFKPQTDLRWPGR